MRTQGSDQVQRTFGVTVEGPGQEADEPAQGEEFTVTLLRPRALALTVVPGLGLYSITGRTGSNRSTEGGVCRPLTSAHELLHKLRCPFHFIYKTKTWRRVCDWKTRSCTDFSQRFCKIELCVFRPSSAWGGLKVGQRALFRRRAPAYMVPTRQRVVPVVPW